MNTLISMAAICIMIAAWVNHILFCFAAQAWGFLVAGAIFVPIGILHGVWLWFH